MLSKLIKYEFKATARTFAPIYAILLVLALANRLTDSFVRTDELPGLRVPLITLLFIAFFAAAIASLVVVLSRFWNNLLGREGYLMHTLPTTPAHHVWAKLIVSTVWFFATAVVITGAVFILTSYSSLWDGIDLRFFTDLFAALSREGATVQSIIMCAELVILAVIATAYSILLFYFAMSVGQTSNNHKVWASIGVYVGLEIVLQNILGSLLINFFTSKMHESVMEYFNGLTAAGTFRTFDLILLGVIVFYAALAALFFYLTQLMLRKKLNLK